MTSDIPYLAERIAHLHVASSYVTLPQARKALDARLQRAKERLELALTDEYVQGRNPTASAETKEPT